MYIRCVMCAVAWWYGLMYCVGGRVFKRVTFWAIYVFIVLVYLHSSWLYWLTIVYASMNVNVIVRWAFAKFKLGRYCRFFFFGLEWCHNAMFLSNCNAVTYLKGLNIKHILQPLECLRMVTFLVCLATVLGIYFSFHFGRWFFGKRIWEWKRCLFMFLNERFLM